MRRKQNVANKRYCDSASNGIIKAARELGGKTKSGRDIRYEVDSAEAFAGIEGLEGESVDLLTVATAVGSMCCFYVGRSVLIIS